MSNSTASSKLRRSPWPPPHQILEIARAAFHRGFEPIRYQIAEKSDNIKQGALAASVGAHQDVEAAKLDIDVP